MASLKSKFQSAIKSGKINIFLLFLLVSFSILLLTKLSDNYVKTVSFQVETLNLPVENVIINDSTHKINVTLKTYGFNLLRYYFSNPILAVDLSTLPKSNNQFLWTANSSFEDINSQFTSNVEVMSIQPDTILFNYDVNDVKLVPVKLNDKVIFGNGYNLTQDFKVVPDSVKVIGPKVLLSKIDTIFTEALVLDAVIESINQKLALILPELIDAVKIEIEEVTVIGEVDKFTEGSVQVPITLINKPNNVTINYFPKQVSVIFYTALSNYKAISANDFVVACDFNDLDNKSSYLIPKIISKPADVKTAKINQSKIEFILSQ